jgi:hypothetical protein
MRERLSLMCIGWAWAVGLTSICKIDRANVCLLVSLFSRVIVWPLDLCLPCVRSTWGSVVSLDLHDEHTCTHGHPCVD